MPGDGGGERCAGAAEGAGRGRATEPDGGASPASGGSHGVGEGVERPLRISVVGAGDASPGERETAREVGGLLARSGAVLVTGGRGGVMEAASRGCAEAGGWTLGVLPGRDSVEANAWVRIPLPTGLGEARNVLVVRAGEAVLAVGGSWGTLSEIAIARKLGLDVGLLGRPPAARLDLPTFEDAEAAVSWALDRARQRRREGP